MQADRLGVCYMHEFETKAFGKINLGLDVTGRREDGYHLVKMVMQTVRLYDRLTFRRIGGSDIVIESNLPYLPVNSNNLVYKAVQLLREEYGIKGGIRIKLDKRIPVAAGMAGGSADAAAALKALNKIYRLEIDGTKMAELGLKLGADVPFCLMGGTALAEGIGEILTPLPKVPPAKVLLVKPPISISTATVYTGLDSVVNPVHPDIDAVIDAIRTKSLTGICACMGNILEPVSAGDHPVILSIKERMKELGAEGAMMSGSGPTVFGIFTDRKAAEHAFCEFKGGEYARNTFLTDFTG